MYLLCGFPGATTAGRRQRVGLRGRDLYYEEFIGLAETSLAQSSLNNISIA